MEFAILILEQEVKGTLKKKKLSSKCLRKERTEEGEFIREFIVKWHEQDKKNFVSLKKAIRFLKTNSDK